MSTQINDVRTFARLTVITGDLDPMYIFMNNALRRKGDYWLDRFALHFFMFYNAGEAIKAAEATSSNITRTGVNFWQYCEDGYKDFKRGTERRHFRGDKGWKAIQNMQKLGSPRQVWDALHGFTYEKMLDNIATMFEGCQIGPYFAWKAMDIMERGMGRPMKLSLEEAVKYMPDQPRECAKALWPNQPLARTIAYVTKEIEDLPAPGQFGRNCSFAEAETILCMLKGYFITKTHTLGDDVNEKHEQMKGYPEFANLLPAQQDWSQYERGILVAP